MQVMCQLWRARQDWTYSLISSQSQGIMRSRGIHGYGPSHLIREEKIPPPPWDCVAGGKMNFPGILWYKARRKCPISNSTNGFPRARIQCWQWTSRHSGSWTSGSTWPAPWCSCLLPPATAWTDATNQPWPEERSSAIRSWCRRWSWSCTSQSWSPGAGFYNLKRFTRCLTREWEWCNKRCLSNWEGGLLEKQTNLVCLLLVPTRQTPGPVLHRWVLFNINYWLLLMLNQTKGKFVVIMWLTSRIKDPWS